MAVGWLPRYDGRIVYHGPPEKVLSHFQAIGYEVPARKDVCDYCIEVCSNVGGDYAKSATTPTTPVALEAAWRGTTEAKESARGLETTKCGGGGWSPYRQRVNRFQNLEMTSSTAAYFPPRLW